MEHKGCFQEFALKSLQIQSPGAPRMAFSPTSSAAHLESFPHPLPNSRLGKRGRIWPWMLCQVTVLSITSPTQTAVWICPLITPQKGGAGTVRWWVVGTHCPHVQGEDERRSTGEMSMHVQISANPRVPWVTVQKAVPQLSWELPEPGAGRGLQCSVLSNPWR